MRRSGEWTHYGSGHFLRRLTCYAEMDWSDHIGDFNDALIAAAPFGGPIAIAESQMGGGASLGAVIKLFSAKGTPIHQLCVSSEVTNSIGGRVLHMGWTSEEGLVLVGMKGTAVYDSGVRAQPTTVRFTKNDGAERITIIRPNGVATVNGSLEAEVVLFREREPPALQDSVDLSAYVSQVTCSELRPPFTDSDPSILLVAGMHSRTVPGKRMPRDVPVLIAITLNETQDISDVDVTLPAPVVAMSVSSDNVQLAAFLESGLVLIMSSDLSAVRHSIDFGTHTRPHALQWCGARYVHLLFQAPDTDPPSYFSVFAPALKLETPFEVVHWSHEGIDRVAAVPECDGLRFISFLGSMFFEDVPDALSQIYRLKATSAEAELCQAYYQLKNSEVNAVARIREIARRKEPAIETTILEVLDAAALEYEPEAQERLLQVVAFSKPGTEFDSELYVDTVKRLRLLNHLRHNGTPLTLRQHKVLSGLDDRNLHPKEVQSIVDRLVYHNRFGLALELATFTEMSIDKVLVRWSVAKVAACAGGAAAEAATFHDIYNRLKEVPSATFVEAAMAAYSRNMSSLAIDLLSAEPRAQTQVEMFLQMREPGLALEKAATSDNMDLLNLVILTAHENISWSQLSSALRRSADAERAFFNAQRLMPSLENDAESLLLESNRSAVVAMDKVDRRLAMVEPLEIDFHEVTVGDFITSVQKRDINTAGSPLFTLEFFAEVQALFQANGEAGEAYMKQCRTQVDLLHEQTKLIPQLGASIVNDTAVNTLKRCIVHGGISDKAIDALRFKFQISDRKFWHLKLQALCEAGNWDAVDKLGGGGKYASSSAKSPIGYLPFIEALHARGRMDQAVVFVPKIPEFLERVEWYIKLDNFQRAIDESAEEGAIDVLHQIKARAQNPQVKSYIDKKLAQLSS